MSELEDVKEDIGIMQKETSVMNEAILELYDKNRELEEKIKKMRDVINDFFEYFIIRQSEMMEEILLIKKIEETKREAFGGLKKTLKTEK